MSLACFDCVTESRPPTGSQGGLFERHAGCGQYCRFDLNQIINTLNLTLMIVETNACDAEYDRSHAGQFSSNIANIYDKSYRQAAQTVTYFPLTCNRT